MEGGTAFKDALQGIIILGKVINARVIPATKGVDRGICKLAKSICNASKP